jgi:hypothetical protein
MKKRVKKHEYMAHPEKREAEPTTHGAVLGSVLHLILLLIINRRHCDPGIIIFVINLIMKKNFFSNGRFFLLVVLSTLFSHSQQSHMFFAQFFTSFRMV